MYYAISDNKTELLKKGLYATHSIPLPQADGEKVIYCSDFDGIVRISFQSLAFRNFVNKSQSLFYISERFRLAHLNNFEELIESYVQRNSLDLLEEKSIANSKEMQYRELLATHNYFNIRSYLENTNSRKIEWELLILTAVRTTIDRYEEFQKEETHVEILSKSLEIPKQQKRKLTSSAPSSFAVRTSREYPDRQLILDTIFLGWHSECRIIDISRIREEITKNRKHLVPWLFKIEDFLAVRK